MKHNAKFYYDFYAAIPEEKWCSGSYLRPSGQMCAVGHILYSDTIDGEEKTEMLNDLDEIGGAALGGTYIAFVNDGGCNLFRQDTPKQRILAALEYAQMWERRWGGRAEEQKVELVRKQRELDLSILKVNKDGSIQGETQETIEEASGQALLMGEDFENTTKWLKDQCLEEARV